MSSASETTYWAVRVHQENGRWTETHVGQDELPAAATAALKAADTVRVDLIRHDGPPPATPQVQQYHPEDEAAGG